MKAMKNMGFGPRKSKKGFTLIELLIVMVILAILAGVVVMAVGGVFGNAKSKAYGVTKDELRNAVADYASRTQGDFPYNSSQTYTISGVARYVINMSPLLTSYTASPGLLSTVPASAFTGTGFDNCDGGATGCSATSHYIWCMDNVGNIYSICTNLGGGSTACANNSSDGFQTVYP